MAETIRYLVTIQPRVSEAPSTTTAGGTAQSVILTDTVYTAIQTLISKIQGGTDVSSVVTAINAL